jgi:hypothetical protein
MDKGNLNFHIVNALRHEARIEQKFYHRKHSDLAELVHDGKIAPHALVAIPSAPLSAERRCVLDTRRQQLKLDACDEDPWFIFCVDLPRWDSEFIFTPKNLSDFYVLDATHSGVYLAPAEIRPAEAWISEFATLGASGFETRLQDRMSALFGDRPHSTHCGRCDTPHPYRAP